MDSGKRNFKFSWWLAFCYKSRVVDQRVHASGNRWFARVKCKPDAGKWRTDPQHAISFHTASGGVIYVRTSSLSKLTFFPCHCDAFTLAALLPSPWRPCDLSACAVVYNAV